MAPSRRAREITLLAAARASREVVLRCGGQRGRCRCRQHSYAKPAVKSYVGPPRPLPLLFLFLLRYMKEPPAKVPLQSCRWGLPVTRFARDGILGSRP